MEAISLAKFLSRYLNLSGELLNHISHEDVKILFPNIKRTSFEYAENNPNEVANGNIIWVDDGKHVIPYVKPEYVHSAENKEISFEKVEPKKIDSGYHDYASMSNYELKCMLNLKFNSRSNSRQARKELENRGVTLTKKYKRNKKIDELEWDE